MLKLTMVLLALAAAPAAGRAAEDPPKVTFAEHIAPLVFGNCTSCHRPGQVAPFSLRTYADAQKHAKTMLRVMEDRFMPPWHPEPGHGEFRNARRLTEEQIKLFAAWVKAGTPEGDPKKTPALPKFPEGWQIGEPDLVVTMDRPFVVPASGPDVHHNFVIPLNLSEDKWVTAVEFKATAPKVVHHVLYFLDDTGRGRSQAAKEGQPGFPGIGFRPTATLGGWAVGGVPARLPDGLAYQLKKGSDLVLQTHFHLSGKEEKETLTIGLYFADKAPKRTLMALQLPPAFGLFSGIDIPAGKEAFSVTDSFTLPVDIDLVGVGAHAHYVGKSMKAGATLPGGVEKKLFSIKDWDFNWQSVYFYQESVRLPKGTVIRADILWDNSAANPRNPKSPPARVTWGEESFDEMGAITFRVVTADEKDTKVLQEALAKYRAQAYLRAKLRGEPIDETLKKMGLPVPGAELPKKAPADPKTPPVTLRDLDGKERTPLAAAGAKASVLFFVGAECPISNGYAPEIAAVAKDFGRSVNCFVVHVDSQLSPDDGRKHAKEYGLTVPVLIDAKHQLVAATGVTRVPEVAVVLPDGTVAYRGRIDDLYTGLGKKRPTATRHDLRDALDAVLAGKSVEEPRTKAFGCSIPDLPGK